MSQTPATTSAAAAGGGVSSGSRSNNNNDDAHYATKPNLFPLHGGCACGHIRYQLAAPPLIVHCCHCTACQRETGSAFAINAIVESAHVIPQPPLQAAPFVVPGSGQDPEGQHKPAGPDANHMPALESADTTPSGTRGSGTRGSGSSATAHATTAVTIPTESNDPQISHRCPLCATAMWSHYGASARTGLMTFLKVSTLDRAWEVDPDVHIFVRSKRGFAGLEDGKPQFEGFYPAARDVYRPDALERRGKLIGLMKEAMSRLPAESSSL